MSNSRKIPQPLHQHRDLRSQPDPGEPSLSYEEQSFFKTEAGDDESDDFHRRFASHRRDSGTIGSVPSSFWRNSSTTNGGAGGAALSRSSSVGEPSVTKRHSYVNTEAERKRHSSLSIPNQKPKGTTPTRNDSGLSTGSSNSRELKKKKEKVGKGRAAERRMKFDAQSSDFDIGHIVQDGDELGDSGEERDPYASGSGGSDMSTFTHQTSMNSDDTPSVDFSKLRHSSNSLDRSSSDQSTGSLLYCKTPSTGGTGSGFGVSTLHGAATLGKTGSLIFPTGVDSGGTDDRNRVDNELAKLKRVKVNLRLDQCEAVRFPFKKKLLLNKLKLTTQDIPMKDLCGTALGNSLHKLSLAGNRLGSVPAQLVQSLPVLKHLDISQCELHQLPETWNLPKLSRLNLSHNRFTEFPEESMLGGLPELQELNMYGNKVAEIIVPSNPKLLSKLEILDLGYNDVVWLPDDLDQIKTLRTLRVMNNFLNKVPQRVCEMDLKNIDVSSNPVTEPPIETCERGICSMRRYWHCIRMEEQSKKKAMSEVQKKLMRQTRPSKKSYGRFMNAMKKGSPSVKVSPPNAASQNVTRKTSFSSTSTDFTAATAASSSASVRKSAVMNERKSASVLKPMDVKDASVLSQPSSSQILPDETKNGIPLKIDHDATETNGIAIDTGSPMNLVADPSEATSTISVDSRDADQVTINDTLKVIFVGMAMVGKTSMIKRLIEGENAVIPNRDERTVGVDIYDWEPKNDVRFEHIDSRIEIQDAQLAAACGGVEVKFSVWDFAGQHVYHATHELFFSNRALYILVWDMGATNSSTFRRKTAATSGETGAFKLYDSSDEEEESNNEMEIADEEEERRANRALEHDIDEKIQFWVDCIQSKSPGAAILPVASFDDFFTEARGGEAEARRRCGMLKQRLLKHEARRIRGIEERLQALNDQNRADDVVAIRLRKLLCSYTRPKLIFGNDNNSVVRVSGTKYTGFDRLTEQVIGIGTGKNRCGWRYPMFHGHIGARIPRMRLEVREAVRAMRGRFKVVEWGYFINLLRDHGLTNVEDISDALHFLTNTGELSYFGAVLNGSQCPKNQFKDEQVTCETPEKASVFDEFDNEIDDEGATTLSLDETSITALTEEGSLTTIEDSMSQGLSQFIFLNPRWLVAAVACILRHDLDRELKETRRLVANKGKPDLSRTASFYDSHLNCPVITSDDACLLWKYKRITKKAAERAQEYSNNMTVTPFEFLQKLLIRFGVFVPIDLSIDKALFGGKEYQQLIQDRNKTLDDQGEPDTPYIINVTDTSEPGARFFFLPSLLGPCEPSDTWTYKSTDSWKGTLCHSVLFPDGVPPGLMERLTASVLSSIYAVSNGDEKETKKGNSKLVQEGRFTVKEVLCWRAAFYLKIGIQAPQADGVMKESVVEIFTHLTGRESHLCVGSDFMGVGMRRLITSGRGQIGDGGRKIWYGGYLLVVQCIYRVMSEYGGLEFEKQGFCPDCLAKKGVSEASSWELTSIRAAVRNSEEKLRCQHGHVIDTRLVAGPDSMPTARKNTNGAGTESVGVPIQDLLDAVVVVGLWDGKTNKIVRVGSGFLVDKKRGLIVTAAHTLMNIWGDKNYPFGENYYGLPRGKVVIGVIPRDQNDNGKDVAIFRYFAQILSKDPSLERGECHVDACVLGITTRMENDVDGDGDGCGDEPEILLVNNSRAMKQEQLATLKISEKCELEEQVRIVGFNQGGEGLLGPGEHLNRYIDFAKGYVCMKFVHENDPSGKRKERFKPHEEIVVICPTIGGHSGGPCVNQQGEVIGILSRADPAENQRCYLVPATELNILVKRAKKQL